MSEEQLERSILERKASEELRAIATAMSLEPVARTRKADLVNQILRAAGVEVDGESPIKSSSPASPHVQSVNGEASEAGAAIGHVGEVAPKAPRGRTARARSVAKTDPLASSLTTQVDRNGGGGGGGPRRATGDAHEGAA